MRSTCAVLSVCSQGNAENNPSLTTTSTFDCRSSMGDSLFHLCNSFPPSTRRRIATCHDCASSHVFSSQLRKAYHRTPHLVSLVKQTKPVKAEHESRPFPSQDPCSSYSCLLVRNAFCLPDCVILISWGSKARCTYLAWASSSFPRLEALRPLRKS